MGFLKWPNVAYLRYVVLHKLYVFLFGVRLMPALPSWKDRLALLWRLLIHDWSKLLPSEFVPYRDKFYGPATWWCDTFEALANAAFLVRWFKFASWLDRRSFGRKSKAEIDGAFNGAWLYHQNRNDHHWQFWILVNDNDGLMQPKPLPMPVVAVVEMVADWAAAGRAIKERAGEWWTPAELSKWYARNKRKIALDRGTRDKVGNLIRRLDPSAADWMLDDMAGNELHGRIRSALSDAKDAGVPLPIGELRLEQDGDGGNGFLQEGTEGVTTENLWSHLEAAGKEARVGVSGAYAGRASMPDLPSRSQVLAFEEQRDRPSSPQDEGPKPVTMETTVEVTDQAGAVVIRKPVDPFSAPLTPEQYRALRENVVDPNPLEQALISKEVFAPDETHPLDCPDHHRASDDGMPPHPEDK
jgi:hypothetical protein